MLLRAFIVFILLLGAYIFFMSHKPQTGTSQHQWQSNAIKAERYLYTRPPEYLIIGSSISEYIQMDSLPGVINFALSGMSIHDALEIVQAAQEFPERVFIEINMVMREPDPEFTSYLLSPIPLFLKRNFIALRSDKQPLALTLPLFRRIRGLVSPEEPDQDFQAEVKIITDNNLEKNDALFQQLLKLQQDKFSRIPDDKSIQKQFGLLKNYVDFLMEHQVQIVFYEMPLHHSLKHSVLADKVRETFAEYFPPEKYFYIPMPEDDTYITTDGVHLKGDEAKKYTSYFKQKSGESIRFLPENL